jgi:transcriptional regulator of NAD metabolism
VEARSKLKQILRSAKARTRETLDEAIAEAIWIITQDNAKGLFNHRIKGLQ